MSRWLPGEHYRVSCEGKVRYESGGAAGKAKQRMKKKRVRHGERRHDVNVYRCQYCSCWHLGGGSNSKPLDR